MDTLTAAERSERMRRVRGRDTKPELVVRRLVHALGYRFRLHAVDLPGRPDIIFRPRRKAVFVHGCFWHRHDDPGCPLARLPKSRQEFWLPKLEGNRARDEAVVGQLNGAGWGVLTIWECQLRDKDALAARLREFLGER
ncbi:MAG: very short patch repair endonuclease [Caulobacter sp.]|nr:very short patch repair endonuclease [Caulobacter sp.]